jgi:hypothetical protein
MMVLVGSLRPALVVLHNAWDALWGRAPLPRASRLAPRTCSLTRDVGDMVTSPKAKVALILHHVHLTIPELSSCRSE